MGKRIGKLSNLIAPIKKNGDICPIGIRQDRFDTINGSTSVTIAWYLGDEKKSKISILPEDIDSHTMDFELRWSNWTSCIHPRFEDSAWVWRCTLDYLADRLRAKISSL